MDLVGGGGWWRWGEGPDCCHQQRARGRVCLALLRSRRHCLSADGARVLMSVCLPRCTSQSQAAGRFEALKLLAPGSVCTKYLALVFPDNGVWFLRIQSRYIFLSASHLELHLAICHLFQLNSLSLGGKGMSGSSSDDYRQKPCVFSSLKLCSIV